jgi:spermidine synthase
MPRFRMIARADTPIGVIHLGRRRTSLGPGWVTQIEIDGHLLMCSVNNESERRLASLALALHRGAGLRDVLVGGLGLGYTAHAALRSPRVASVRVVEKMDFVTDWMAEGLLPLSETLANEERLSIVLGDVYDELLGPPTHAYDVILVDVDHAPDDRLSDASRPFYTVEGQSRVARHLKPGGVLAVWSATDNDEFAETLAAAYLRAHREQVEWVDVEDPGITLRNVVFLAERAA